MKVDVKGLFLTCQTSLLFQGIALIDRNCMPEVIWYFPVEDLPEDVGERFNTLFKTREKWSLAEISPYIRYISSPYINYIISPYATQMFSPLILIITHLSVTSPHPPNIRFIISHYISYITSYFIINIISHFISYITSLPPFTSGMLSPLTFFPYKIQYCISSVHYTALI